jgi:hypothetical protein
MSEDDEDQPPQQYICNHPREGAVQVGDKNHPKIGEQQLIHGFS